jgi:tetratricopeptide (TPR) repeat protein
MADAAELYDQADQLKDQGKLEEAVARFNEALSIDPSYALAHAALAVVEQKLGHHESAVQHAQKVCELAPDDPFSYTALSVILQRVYAGTGDMSFIRLAEDAMERSRILQARR